MEGLNKLKGSRKAYRSHLTRIYGKLEELDLTQPPDEDTIITVTSYIEQIQRKAESIQQLDTQIQSMMEDPTTVEDDVSDSLETQDLLIEKITRLKRYLEKSSSATHALASPVSVTHETAPQPVSSRLPKLDLPKFSGDPLGWQTFWDSFQAAVHSNTRLTGVEKFNYLRSLLEGEASRTVSGFTLTTANYEQSISLLESRFGKKQKVINAHMKALWHLPVPSNTASSLRQLHDTIVSHIRGLESLGKNKDTFGDLLVYLVLERLPPPVVRNLTRNRDTGDEWNIDELCSAIEKEIIVLESGLDSQDDGRRSTVTGSFLAGVRKGQMGQQPTDKRIVSAKPLCVYCKGPHSSAQCNTVVDLKARVDVVKRERLCFNCLGSHRVTHCNSKNRCRLCHRKHHTSLCGIDNLPSSNNTSNARQQNGTPQCPQTNQSLQSSHTGPPASQTPQGATANNFVPSQQVGNYTTATQPLQTSQTPQDTVSLTSPASQGSLNPASQSFVPAQQVGNYTTATQPLLGVKRSPQCLLKTAIAVVRLGDKRIAANILFDEGAQRSFVTETLAAQLNASPHHKESLSISSFGGSTSLNNQVDLVNFFLETTEGDVKLSALVVSKIAAPIQNFVNSDLCNLPHLQGLTLAHPISSTEKFEISLLIGVDFYWEIVGNHIVRGRGPTAMQSKLGYLLSGPLPVQSESTAGSLHSYTTQTFTLEVSDCPESITKDCPPIPTLCQQDVVNNPPPDSFLLTYQESCILRDADGSYVVRFPWKDNHPFLPSNLAICDRQTRALARRLSRQPGLLQLYGSIIANQEQRNFIERAPSQDNGGIHYIPHHPVRKNSQTTPIRIVYNCSCRQSPRHASLNDCLMVGDPALTDLCAVLLRFRLHCYALSTDIEKPFFM